MINPVIEKFLALPPLERATLRKVATGRHKPGETKSIFRAQFPDLSETDLAALIEAVRTLSSAWD